MIHQSRKWRMVIRIVALVATSALMLAFAGPVSYALQADTPKLVITQPEQLSNKEKPVSDAFVYVNGLPERSLAVRIDEGIDDYYWVPLQGYGNQLFVRAEDSRYAFPNNIDLHANKERPLLYVGKITPLNGRAGSKELIEEMAQRGIEVDKESAMVLLQGEQPSTYRPMVPVIPVLAWIWLAALVGTIQILRGRHPRRALNQATVAARNVR